MYDKNWWFFSGPGWSKYVKYFPKLKTHFPLFGRASDILLPNRLFLLQERREPGDMIDLLKKIKLMVKVIIIFSNLISFHSDLLKAHQISINLTRFMAARDFKHRAILMFHPKIDISQVHSPCRR